MSEADVVLRPILAEDAGDVAAFLHRELNPRVSVDAWRGLLRPPWGEIGPNHGFQLVTTAGDILGVYAAVYAHRTIAGDEVVVCNLAAFCVQEAHRAQGLRLMRALLGQKDMVFTDLSPSGNVVAMNERLGFQRLDATTRLVLNTPALPPRGVRVTDSPIVLARTLRGADAQIYRDHRGAGAARHLLVTRGDEYGYVVYRRDRRKRAPLFASPLYAGGDRALVDAAWSAVRAHLLHRGYLFTLAERRILGFARGLGTDLSHPRPKMLRGEKTSGERTPVAVDPDAVDYLYSELALLRW